MFKYVAATAILFCATAVPVGAATLYDCTIKGADDRAWIQPRILFLVDDTGQSVKIADGIIYGVTGQQWLDGTVARNSADSVRTTWDVRTEDNKNQRTEMNYTAEIDRVEATVAVTARPGGFDNYFFNRGSCTTKKVK